MDEQEMKVQQLAEKIKPLGKPALVVLRAITWEQPLSWAIIFASWSILYVILFNLSIKTFSILGLLALWLDFYCLQNGIKIPEITDAEEENLHRVCSKLIVIKKKVQTVFNEWTAVKDQNPSRFHQQAHILLALAILISYFVDNLLLTYLLGSSVLLMIGICCPH